MHVSRESRLGRVKGAISRITRLLSHDTFGAKNSLERQKNLLIKRNTYRVIVAFLSSSFPTKIKRQIVIKLTSSSSKLSPEQQAANTKNNKLSNISSTSDSESKIKKYA